MERSGGHMGYVSGNLPNRRWLDYALSHYLDQLLALPWPAAQPAKAS